MRLLPLVLVVMAAPAVADTQADANKAVAALVQKHVAGIAKLEADDDKLGLAKDAFGIVREGWKFDRKGCEDCSDRVGGQRVFDSLDGTATVKITKTLVGSSGDVGWFHVTASSSFKYKGGSAAKETLRFSGLATKSGNAWTIAAIAYGEAVPDSALASRRRAVPRKTKTDVWIDGDKKVATLFAGWYAQGFASHAGAVETLVASGTAPAESAKGAAGLRLVKSWDKLELEVSAVNARLVAGGSAAWIDASVLLPRKGKKLPSVLQVSAVLVPDGADWRWVAIHYASPHPAGMEDVMDDKRLIEVTPPGE